MADTEGSASSELTLSQRRLKTLLAGSEKETLSINLGEKMSYVNAPEHKVCAHDRPGSQRTVYFWLGDL